MIVIEIVVVEGFECVKEVLSRGVNFNLLPARDLWKFVALKILPDSLYHLQLHKLHVQTAIALPCLPADPIATVTRQYRVAGIACLACRCYTAVSSVDAGKKCV